MEDMINNPLVDDAHLSTSNTSTLRPLPAPKLTTARAARRLSSTSQTSTDPPIRPTPAGSRSSVTSPTRRPYSPPSSGQRPVSPPTRARSVMTARSVASGPHAQQSLAENSVPKAEDLARFVALCRELYYEKNASAAQAIDATLARLSPQQKTPYARAMADVRSRYHRDEENRRRQLIESTLAAHEPGQRIKRGLGVSAGGVMAMRSTAARNLRSQLLKNFIATHCDKSMPGTHPFFKSLYGAMRLQSLPVSKGGAGPRRVEWEVDVTVFTEAGGGAWMQDSVEALKSTLGCTEYIKETRPDSLFEAARADADAESNALISPGLDPSVPLISVSSVSPDNLEQRSQPKRTPPAVPPHRGTLGKSTRNRALSDPFSDPADGRTLVADGGPLNGDQPQPPSPGLSSAPTSPLLSSSSSPTASPTTVTPPSPGLSASPVVQYRIFTLPAFLTDPELRALCRLFPEFIARASEAQRLKATNQPLPTSKCRSSLKDSAAAMEVGGDTASMQTTHTEEEGAYRLGHGVLRFGLERRDEGWVGTLWERLIHWLKALFGLA